jgi:cell division protein YceG involved in septum cleavage
MFLFLINSLSFVAFLTSMIFISFVIDMLEHAVQDKCNQNISITNEINIIEVKNATKDKELIRNKNIIKALTDELEVMNKGLEQYQL